MAKSFRDLVTEGREAADKIISPQEAQQQMKGNAKTLVLDVREPDDAKANGRIPGSINIPLGVLPIKAAQDLPEALRDARLQDRDTPIITTCGLGGQASLAAKTLKEMGFTNVSIIDGGTGAWKNAGLPTE